jgi:two-component system, cell cycle response regulator DivK
MESWEGSSRSLLLQPSSDVVRCQCTCMFAGMDRRIASRPQRVLLVDDSDVVREMWKAWLTFWGFIVDEARYAAEAVEKARTRLPDLIVMDLAVPVRHGRQALKVLASDPFTAAVPVLASNPQTYAVIPHASQGAEGFKPRPANPDHLLAQIRHTFRRAARTSPRHA